MNERLTGDPWITDPRTVAVMDALEAGGGAGCARFVGGCVRNGVIGRPVDDIDIATTVLPEATARALQAAGLKAVPTGVEHGTVTAISGRRPYEITTLRRDVETDGRHAVVAFTTDWGEDARRRDFTLNALYAGRDGAIFDPTGRGIADARAGRIVFVGAPEDRIREDYLRILRFFRFFAWYGKGDPDPAAVAACSALKDQVATLAAERISKELIKLLGAADPRPAVALMARTGVLATVLPAPADLSRFEALVEIEADQLFECEPVLRLAALIPDDPAAGRALAERLRLSNAERDRLAAALGREPELNDAISPAQIRRLVYRQGAAVFRDRAKLAWAAGGLKDSAGWLSVIAKAGAWTAPAFPLTGHDVAAAGVAKGPRVGQVLRTVEDWWVAEDFPEDPAALDERLKAAVREAGL